MRRHLLFLLSIVIISPALAVSRSHRQMISIAHQQLQQQASVPLGYELDIRHLDGNEELAIYGDSLAGFVVVSRDPSQQPVLGVSASPYFADHIPDGFRWWLSEMTTFLKTQHTASATSMIPIVNFVQTRWGQWSPYNGTCPTANGKSCPTGCVATAIAQIMRYFQYPTTSKGQGAYTINGEKEKTVSINSTYEWNKMLYNYTTSAGSSNKKAVQGLMSDAGASVFMDYSPEGSASHIIDAAIAMFKNFRYDSLALRYCYKDLFNEEEWLGMLYHELALKRPVLYGANDATGESGHAFLMTGNDNEGKIYVNWGWDGYADGFFEFANLILDSYHFTAGHEMVIGFRTQETPDDQDQLVSSWATLSPYKVTPLSKNRLEFSIADMFNYHLLYFNGQFKFCFRNVDTGKLKTYSFFTSESVAPFWGFGPDKGEKAITETISVSSLPAGTYDFFFASQAIGESTPSEIRVNGKGYSPIRIIKNIDGSFNINGEEPDEPSTIHSLKPAAANDTEVWHDLQGHRISQPQERGIYIRNNHKILLR